MNDFEEAVKTLLEETFNQPLSSRAAKRFLKALFESLFGSLVKDKSFSFPKGFGSLRVKELKPFEITKKNGTVEVVKGKRVIRYFPGHQIKRRIQDGG